MNPAVVAFWSAIAVADTLGEVESAVTSKVVAELVPPALLVAVRGRFVWDAPPLVYV
jgi:hypothetical protein